MMFNVRLSRLLTVALAVVTLFCLFAHPQFNRSIAEALTATPSITPTTSDLPDLTITSHWLAFDARGCSVIGIQFTVSNLSDTAASTFDISYVDTGEVQTVVGLGAGDSIVVAFTDAGYFGRIPTAIVDPSNLIAESDETNNNFVAEWPLPIPTQSLHCMTPEATTPAPDTITVTPDCNAPIPTLEYRTATPDNMIPPTASPSDCPTVTPHPTATIDCNIPAPTPDGDGSPTSTPHPDCVPTPIPDCITPTPTPSPDDFFPTATRDHTPTPTSTPHPDCPTATPSPTPTPDCNIPTATPTSTLHPDCLTTTPTPTSTPTCTSSGPTSNCDTDNWPAYVPDLTIVSHSLAFDDRGCSVIGVRFTIFNRSLAPAYAFEVMYVDTGEVQTVAELVGGETIAVTFEGGNYHGGFPSAIVDSSNVVLGDIEENNEYVAERPLPIPTQSLHCMTPPATTPAPVEIPITPTANCITPTPTPTPNDFNPTATPDNVMPTFTPTLHPDCPTATPLPTPTSNCILPTATPDDSPTSTPHPDCIMPSPTPIPETPSSSNSTANPTATSNADTDTSSSNTPLSIGLDMMDGETAVPFGLIALVVATTLLLAGSYVFARKQ